MRLCRFFFDEYESIGFFFDNRVVPVETATEAYVERIDPNFELPSISDPLEFLPPLGEFQIECLELYRWVETLNQQELDELSIPARDVEMLTPIGLPPKILLLAGNYAEHIAEQGGMAAERAETFPYVFMKPGSTLNTHEGPVVIPSVSPDHIDWECELGVVIGAICKGVSEEEALSYVAGYTIVNDISDRKFRPNPRRKTRDRDKHFDWLHGKWHDTFLPIGPCVLSGSNIDPARFHLSLKVNGETKQNCGTDKMIFPVAAIISFISQWVTLEPGDLIATGTPSGVGNATGTYLKHGDMLEAAISEIGVLRNPVVSEEDWIKAMEKELADHEVDEFDE
jgi:2-keto-4-pentenoate hydratase/2-oxohepta-3-ene-1,7-dioic acid hydratase in catechol pathway